MGAVTPAPASFVDQVGKCDNPNKMDTKCVVEHCAADMAAAAIHPHFIEMIKC